MKIIIVIKANLVVTLLSALFFLVVKANIIIQIINTKIPARDRVVISAKKLITKNTGRIFRCFLILVKEYNPIIKIKLTTRKPVKY